MKTLSDSTLVERFIQVVRALEAPLKKIIPCFNASVTPNVIMAADLGVALGQIRDNILQTRVILTALLSNEYRHCNCGKNIDYKKI